MTEKRFVAIDDDEVYYITDTKGLKTLDDFIKEFSKPEYGFTEDEALEHAKEEYWQLIYEASMTATENVNMLNELHEENKHLQGKTSSWKRTASKEISEKQKLVKRIVKLEKENKELQQELFESECAYIHERYYHKSEIEEEIEELKIEFKARFGRDFE